MRMNSTNNKLRGELFMNWIIPEGASRAALRHAVACPNLAGRTKERVAQNKGSCAVLLATVEKS